MGMHITSKSLKPVVGALGIAVAMGTGMAGCGHHPPGLSNKLSMSPSSAHLEVSNTVGNTVK
jgi:hypothetical protein